MPLAARGHLAEEKKKVRTRTASRLNLEGVDILDAVLNASILPEKRNESERELRSDSVCVW